MTSTVGNIYVGVDTGGRVCVGVDTCAGADGGSIDAGGAGSVTAGTGDMGSGVDVDVGIVGDVAGLGEPVQPITIVTRARSRTSKNNTLVYLIIICSRQAL